MIRRGTIEDQEAMLDLGELMHAESVYSVLPFDRDKARKEVQWTLRNGIVLIYEVDGIPRGLMMGYVRSPWFSQSKVGYEEALYIHPDHRGGRAAARMILEWQRLCAEKGAELLKPSTACGVKGADRLYGALGFQPVGATFVKEL